MTTDRELLEWAAKAVNNGAWHPLTHDTPNGKWNPLVDDGDALRLAVKLNLIIECMVGQSAARTFNNKHAGCVDHADAQQYPMRDFNPDPAAATRRSIVRAAASIGQQKGE